MKYFLSAALLLGSALGASAQLYVGSAQSLTIDAGATFSYDGLVLQPSSDFTISSNTLVRNNAITEPSLSPAIARAYTLSAPLPGFSGTIVMPYATGELGSIPEAGLQFNMHDGTSWAAYPGVLNTTAKTVTVSGLSNVAIGEVSLAAAAAPLPLTLISFSGTTEQGANIIRWKTADEKGISHFELERSADAISFTQIAKLGSGSAGGEYKHRDDAAGPAYYRLRSVERGGQSALSSVIRLGGEDFTAAFSVVPNPASGSLRIDVAAPSANAQVSITDLAGRALLQQAIAGSSTMLNVSQLPSGIYLVRYQDGAKSHSIRLNKL